MKTCSECKLEKSIAEYYIRSNGYAHSRCKPCYQQYVNAYKAANGEKVRQCYRASGAKRRKRIRDAVFEAYGGYICACCGETEWKFLTLDHIDNDGSEFRQKMLGKRTASGMATYFWLQQNGYPSGYQVLCMNCNYGKQMNKGICPHKERCNDYPKGVGTSVPKSSAAVRLKI